MEHNSPAMDYHSHAIDYNPRESLVSSMLGGVEVVVCANASMVIYMHLMGFNRARGQTKRGIRGRKRPNSGR
jgi:hypothetical protein